MDITLVIGLIGFLGSLSILIVSISYLVIKGIEIKCKGVYDGLRVYCGGRFGELNLTFPFVRLDFTSEYLKITHSCYSERIYYGSIGNVSLYEGMISRGIKIDACFFDCSDFILWVIKPEQVIDFIRKNANNCFEPIRRLR